MTSFMTLMLGRYGCMRGRIWVHVRADMGSCEQAIMGKGTESPENLWYL